MADEIERPWRIALRNISFDMGKANSDAALSQITQLLATQRGLSR